MVTATTHTPEVSMEVRRLAPTDSASIAALAREAFPPTQSSFVQPGRDGGLVACVDGAIAAAAIVRVIQLPGGRSVGMIAWLLTGRDYRGLGLASRLVQACVDDLHARGCQYVLTDVEGHNTASANVFHGNGFKRLPPGEQVRCFGLAGSMWLAIRTGLVFDPGHFLWVYDTGPGAPREGAQRVGSWLVNTLFAGAAMMLGSGLLLAGAPGLLGVADWLAFALAVVVLFGAREGAMRVTGAWFRQPLQYRAWEGGFGITLIIALLFGRLLPLPGGLYPPGDGWKYRDVLPRLGPVAVAGTLAVALIVAGALMLKAAGAGGFMGQFAFAVLFVGKPLLLFDSAIAIAPFTAFNARRIFDYNRALWAGVAALGIVLFLL